MSRGMLRESLLGARPLVAARELQADGGEGSRLPEVVSAALTPELAARAAATCPTGALALLSSGESVELDYGKCVGCGRCVELAPAAFRPRKSAPPCGVRREGLVWGRPGDGRAASATAAAIRRRLGRALNIRQVDAGSCNGCEAEIAALTNPYYDLEQFGIHFVASPRHADMLLVTGPVTRNMEAALRATFAATPAPKLVVAVGACGCSGGLFAASAAVAGPVDAVIPVDAYVPGCPPTPAMLLAGILRVLGRL